MTRGTTEELYHSIENRIIALRMVAVDETDFIYERALTIVFKENYEAKQELKRIAKRINPSMLEKQERFYQLDDERSFQSRSAWMRVRRLRRKQMLESGEHFPQRAVVFDIPSQVENQSDSKQKTALLAELKALPPNESLPIVKSLTSEVFEDGHAPTESALAIEASVSTEVFVFASLDMVGNRFVYKLTIKSCLESIITDVTSTIVAYPKECLHLSTDYVKVQPRLEIGGFLNESFVLTPTKDCVEGNIVAVVSYVDHQDEVHTVQVSPYIIRSVCDLLQPYESSFDEYQDVFRGLVGGADKINLRWNASVILDKAQTVLPLMNFYLLDVQKDIVDEQIYGKIRGFALGKYTEKRVAVLMKVTGAVDADECVAEVEVSGDDDAMFPTTMGEIADKIDAWICMQCGARLNPDQVMEIEAGGVLTCRYCSHTLTLDLYCRSDQKPRSRSLSEVSVLGFEGASTELVDGAPASTSTHAVMTSESAKIIKGVSVLRGCELVGGKFEYKVKVRNESHSVITNVAVTIVAYPRDSLTLVGSAAKVMSRIEIGGFRSPGFTFVPTKDCVRGGIVAAVTFIDYQDKTHTIHTKPFTIRSVCDLLKPVKSTPKRFELSLEEFDGTSEEYELDWNPAVLFRRAEHFLPSRNFYTIDTRVAVEDGIFSGTIRGYAEGKYTKSKVAVSITIEGNELENTSVVKVASFGSDEAMLPITLEDLRKGIDSWVCLNCGASLSSEQVQRIKNEEVIECRNCGHSLNLTLYRK
ncbi:hypothetical protein EU528_07290 [Candidatus Thorarchaeota archaeon]|nr:MAG: hypothetical protein EU528_07290 [Candidatus Thorarchaeota archaeon]